MTDLYDVAIIGGGPAGYSAAVRVAQLKGRAVLFERDSLGGTCLNVGCIPTKFLLDKSHLIEEIKKNTSNGILKSAGLFSWSKIQENKKRVVKKLVTGVATILKSYGIDVIKDDAYIKEPGVIGIKDSNKEILTKNIIIATGSKVFIPNIKGVDGRNVLDSTGALNIEKLPRNVVIIGGGIIGIEFASIFNSFGAKVTIIEMLPDIVFNEDKEVISYLKKDLISRGIEIITEATVYELCDSEDVKIVKYRKGTQNFQLKSEKILVAVGRKPNSDDINMEKIGVKMDNKKFIKTDDRMATNIPGIYAAGDVIGGYQLAHSAYSEAICAAENCMGLNSSVNLSLMPRCIYSIPQIAAIGLTEEKVKEKDISYNKRIVPYTISGRAAACDETKGFVKILTDESNRLLGVHIIGYNATELISIVSASMKLGAKTTDFEDMIFPHPTFSELIKESMLSINNEAINVPKFN